ncbi:MAG: hypothetical protein J4F36_12535 [Nitrosopumilaceae archaeon]|nr:hypothetical protein [Nitrosopumilaceae archaeon]
MIKEAIEDQKQYQKSCKRCLKVSVCQAYALAQATNDQFGSIQFIELKKPIIEKPDSLAESCKEYCPPLRALILCEDWYNGDCNIHNPKRDSGEDK